MLPSDNHDFVYQSVVPPPSNFVASFVPSHVSHDNSSVNQDKTPNNEQLSQKESRGNFSHPVMEENVTKFEKNMDETILVDQ